MNFLKKIFFRFKNKYNLKAHEETHTREKSVQCTECGKQFSCKSALKNHMEGHTGVFTKIFKCDFCDRVFRNSYNMQQHRRTHTGEKPFRWDFIQNFPYDKETEENVQYHKEIELFIICLFLDVIYAICQWPPIHNWKGISKQSPMLQS